MSQPASTDQPQELVPIVSGDEYRIPLDPPAPLTKEDGSFDHEKISNHISWIAHKYRKILADIEPNYETEALGGAEIKDPTDMGLSTPAPVPLSTRGKMWTAPISIGSPGQQFTVEIDTGSADLWVPNSQAKDASAGRNSYNPSVSTTGRQLTGTFKISYGDSLKASGPIYSDTVAMGSAKATGQHFSPVTSISENFQQLPIDGILGLGFELEAELKAPPFIQNAAALRQIPSPTFALKLTKTRPSINLGGITITDFKGSIEYHNIVGRAAIWKIPGASITLNGKVVASNFQTFIDSGDGTIVGPSKVVKAFYDAIPGSKVYNKEQGLYSYPTKTPPAVSFKWGSGKAWAVSAENFSLGPTRDPNQTVGALIGLDFGLGQDVWILGSKFLQNVYSVFDFSGTPRIGFAELD